MTDRPVASPLTRVALRIAGGPGPAYLAAAAEEVLRVPGAEVVLVLATGPAEGPAPTRGWLPARIEALYAWLERRALRGGPGALLPRTFTPSAPGIPVIRDAPPANQADALQAARADVLIDLAPDAGADPLAVPPLGRWRLRYAGTVDGPRGPHLARPGSSVALAESLLSIELPSGQALEACVGVSALHRIGYGRDRDAVYWRSALLPARRLARLVAGDGIPCEATDRPPPSRVPPVAPGPSPSAETPFVGLAAAVLGRVVEKVVFHTAWCVLVRRDRADGTWPRDLSGFEAVEAPTGRFYADPFVVATPDGPRIYVEDCPAGAHRGRISTLHGAGDGRWVPERVVLNDLEHRAYPHVLRTDGELVLTPDSGRTGGVDLFVDHGAAGGPRRVGRCLEGVPASDPTLLWHEGRYWLFVAVTGHGMNPWDELHLYWATSLTDLWHPHPLNPVVADVRRARPAGRIFRTGDGLIRPGQDCSEAYGRRIVLSAITTLTPQAYAERPIGSIEPQGLPGVLRTHTYSFDGSIEALDGYRRVPRLRGRLPRR